MDDVLILGGGVFGLWCARACLEAGLSVTLAEAGRLGAGASATPVGALAPHDPVGRSELKALQLAGLRALPGEVAALEAETGMATGYARTGRLALLSSAAAAARLPERAAAARATWGPGEALRPATQAELAAAGVAPRAAPHGAAFDTLTARIDPPRYLAALARSIEGRARVLEGWRAGRLVAGGAEFDQGRIAAGAVVVAAGWESARLLGLAWPEAGVKGQSAVLDARLPPETPAITRPGLYVVGHAQGVAVGSTAERDWARPGPDDRLDPVIAAARETVPALADAPVLRRWAGIRPRAPGAGPMIGPWPGETGLWAATGGYKIGLALAHLAGRAVAAGLAGGDGPALPESAAPASHLAKLAPGSGSSC